ncbi:MAG: hypothetical protein Athens101410_534 [Parcubacteria group bacterium Athens1014_10]|nr:MAG: hypothetical protein Athens101410_534 [Parcubacteria group bacterium Athens1014_10]TSD05460.1 MAG: hypothetical protein Athens071412_369 [Parcubacteria group bacterium Athens0714_12]
MRNEFNSKIEKIIALSKGLPYFTFDAFSTIEKNKTYLKILLSRYEKNNKLIRLKKGIYVNKEYFDQIQKNNTFNFYSEFLSNILYQPSYLSLDYVLYQHNLLTELPVNFTSISKNKTAVFSNKIGNFIYHKVKNELFCGFKIIKNGDFIISKASKAKALFDFLYLRKNILINKKAVEELRLNLGDFNKGDLREFKKYLKIEKSKKMKEISGYLFK